MTLYAITEKKAVHKPFSVPYFVTASFEVADWANRSHLFGDPSVRNRMLNVVDCNTWGLTPMPVVPVADQSSGAWKDGNASVSPIFRVSPLTIYGTVDKLVMPDGTTYGSWFTPEFSIDPNLSNYTHDADPTKYNARVVVPMDFWHEHHVFRQWEPNPDWVGEPVSHMIVNKAR